MLIQFLAIEDFALPLLLLGLFLIIARGVFVFRNRNRLVKVELNDNDRRQINHYLSSMQYYQSLSLWGKEKFAHRLVTIRANKEFTGMEGLVVTEEMKIRISACAAQLTFGLDHYVLPDYYSIRIFPRTFYSHLIHRELKGGTTAGGTIFFSWQDFKEGYDIPDDKYNLGLHEMAHALRLEGKWRHDFDHAFQSYSGRWEMETDDEFERMRGGYKSFLRAYGGVNKDEFFAVCVEHFFEVPEAFKNNLPRIYRHLCLLLRQDPCNKHNDYALADTSIYQVHEP